MGIRSWLNAVAAFDRDAVRFMWRTDARVGKLEDWKERVVGQIQDLQAADAAVVGAVQDGVAKIADLGAQLAALVNQVPPPAVDDPAVAQVIVDLNQAAADLNAAVKPPETPAV